MFPVVLRVRSFARDDRGGVLAEFVMVLPALMWAYLALFVYWDAFRNTNTVQKAAYTISDTISREMITFPTTYVDGLRNVMDYMIDADQDVKMRVTSITYDIDALQFQVLWSYSPSGAMPELTTETLQLLKERIPKMSDADYATILETEVTYVPSFNVGMDDQVIQQFIITRPRFVAPSCMSGRVCTSI